MSEVKAGERVLTPEEISADFQEMYKKLAEQQLSSGIVLDVDGEQTSLPVGYDEDGNVVYEYYGMNAYDYQKCRRHLAELEMQSINDELETYRLRQGIKTKRRVLGIYQEAEKQMDDAEQYYAADVEEYILPNGKMQLFWALTAGGEIIQPDCIVNSPDKEGVSVKIWTSLPKSAILASVRVEDVGYPMEYRLHFWDDSGTITIITAAAGDSAEGYQTIANNVNATYDLSIGQLHAFGKLQADILKRVLGQTDDAVMFPVLIEGWLIMTNDGFRDETIKKLHALYEKLVTERIEAIHDEPANNPAGGHVEKA